MEQWLEEYDELVRDVAESSYQTFPLNVQRWLDFIDSHELVAAHLHTWEHNADFTTWWSEAQKTHSAMVGSGQLNWPREQQPRLALQLGLFRAFGSEDIQIPPFALQFFFVRDGDFNAQTSNIAQRLFLPFARELRRSIQKLDLTNPPIREASVPAADRTVPLDHNSNAYNEAIDALNKVRDAVAESNEYDDPQEKAQSVAELDASRALLDAPRVRVDVVESLTMRCLKYLRDRFVEGLIGILVTAAIAAIAALVGIQV